MSADRAVPPTTSERPRARRLVIGALAVAAVARLATLGAYPLPDSTESRYAEIAREMLAGGDWVMPRIDLGRPFWAKPPLSTWCSAASMGALGVGEFAARLPSFVFMLLTGLLVYAAGRRLASRGLGLTAAAIFASSALGFGTAGTVMTDPSLGFATTLTMTGVVLALLEPGSTRGRLWGLAAFAGAGIGLLAKGPVALLLTVPPVLGWALWTRRLGDLRRSLPLVAGTLLAAAIAVPWYVLAEHRTPGFLRYFLVGEHVQRFLDPTWSGDLYGHPRTKPRGAIWPMGIAFFLPWCVHVAPPVIGWVRARLRRLPGRAAGTPDGLGGVQGLLVAWTLWPFIVFTPSGSAMGYYVLPALPAFALLAARWITRAARDGLPPRPRRFAATVLFVPVLFAAVVPFASGRIRDEHSNLGLLERAAREGGPATTVAYLGDPPPSADFYSGGEVRRMAAATAATWDRLAASGEPVFVVSEGLHEKLPEDCRRARLRRIVDVRNRTLWRLIDRPR